MTTTILTGDCREVLRSLPDQSFHCCVTSPPYFGLRDYGVDGQIGLEPTPDDYVAEMVAVFREVKRVLRDDGTLWLNIGDSYNNFRVSMGPGQAVHGRDKLNGKPAPDSRRRGCVGLKEKDLIGIPWMLAFALRADGWYLRSEIIWHKPNPMPESVTDRPTKAHEQVFLLTKRPSYFYDAEAIKEPGTVPAGTKGAKGSAERAGQPGVNSRPPEYKVYDGTRNARSVWTIATKPFAEAHFATFPPELAERCIRAGTSERGCCSACGAPWVRQVERTTSLESGSGRSGIAPVGKGAGGAQITSGSYDIRMGPVVSTRTTGWGQACECPGTDPAPCSVLDPFGGAGTTALVADRLGRDCTLIELNPAYADMARRRIGQDAGLFAEVIA